MVKADIFSGFLGAGKTTLIKKLIAEGYKGEKLVLIENEFGDIGIDGSFMKESGIEITEMNSGCICCSLVGDFEQALKKVCEELSPDRILIEPSGVGKLSDVIKAVSAVDGIEIGSAAVVADAMRCKMYAKNFGEFYDDQIKSAGTIILSRTGDISQNKLHECVELLKQRNGDAIIITTPWSELTGAQILDTIHRSNTIETQLQDLFHAHEHEHHHDEECDCGYDHHEHHHDEEPDSGHDHHEHHHDEECGCGHDHHEHEHHHHADDVFASWGVETPKKFTKSELKEILGELDNSSKYGIVLRAKGIVASDEGWLHFDFVPGEPDIRTGGAEVTGRLCVIGSQLKTDELKTLFGA